MTLDRRAFLRLATGGRERVLELTCERLYLRWVDALGGPRQAPHADAGSGWFEGSGEPPASLALETRADLLAQVEAGLAGAQALRVVGPEWLADGELRREIESRVAAFRRSGGRMLSLALAVLVAACLALPAGATAQVAPVPDDVLRSRVEAAIVAAADLPTDSIAVHVSSGVVTLTGSLICSGCGGNATPGGTGTVQQSLGAVVRAVPGVAEVRFRLIYRPPA